MNSLQHQQQLKAKNDALTLENKTLYKIVGINRDLVERALDEALALGARKIVSLLQDVLRPVPKEDISKTDVPHFLRAQGE